MSLIFTSQPTIRSLPAAHHEEVCDYQSSTGSFRSQYITISSSFTDAFSPSRFRSTPNHLLLRRLCYRRCLIVGMFLAVAVAVASLCLLKRQMLSYRFATVSSSRRFQSSLRMSTALLLKTAPS